MIRKILAFAIIAVMLCTCAPLALAQEAPTPNWSITVTPDGANGAVEVFGEFDSSVTQADGMVIFSMEDSNGVQLLMDFTRTFRDEESGKIKFSFGKIQLQSTILSDKYTVEVSGDDFSVKYRDEEFWYILPGELLNILQMIEEYTKDDTKAVADAYTNGEAEDNSANALKVGLDMGDYNKFGTVGKTAYDNVMKTKEYDLPTIAEGEPMDEEDLAKIREATADTKLYHRQASAVGLFAEIDDVTEFTAWYNRYYNDTTAVDTAGVFDHLKIKDMTSRLQALLENSFLAEKVAAVNTIEGEGALETVIDVLYEGTLITELVGAKSNAAAETLLRNASKTESDYFYGIDWSGYGNLGSTEKGKVMEKVRGENAKEFDSCGEIVDKVNELIGDDDSGDDGDDGDGNSGGRGGAVYMPGTTESEAEENPASVFDDLGSVEWAKEAIEYLYKKGVVNGVGDGLFSPNNNVTRAEFIKMIISGSAIGISDADSPFGDVANDSWYAPYVVAASEAGLVLGDDKGNFNPDATITREGMVTILYRSIGAPSGGKAEFTDDAEISPYAKNAVIYFASKGIVNGVGDGRFAPKANATRAEAAVIIYRIINS